MFFLFLIALVLGVLVAGGLLGFTVAVYLLRPGLIERLIPEPDLDHLDRVRLLLGLGIAAATPLVAALSYAMSGGSFFVSFFGPVAELLWAWTAGAAVFGVFIGAAFRPASTEKQAKRRT